MRMHPHCEGYPHCWLNVFHMKRCSCNRLTCVTTLPNQHDLDARHPRGWRCNCNCSSLSPTKGLMLIQNNTTMARCLKTKHVKVIIQSWLGLEKAICIMLWYLKAPTWACNIRLTNMYKKYDWTLSNEIKVKWMQIMSYLAKKIRYRSFVKERVSHASQWYPNGYKCKRRSQCYVDKM